VKFKYILKLIFIPLFISFLISLNFKNSGSCDKVLAVFVFNGNIIPQISNIGSVLKTLSPIIIFCIITGDYFYRFMTKTNVYSFIRYDSRNIFAIHKIIKHLSITFIFSASYIVSGIYFNRINIFDKDVFEIIFICFIMLFSINIFFSVIMNICSFFCGNTASFLYSMSLMAFLTIEYLVNDISDYKNFSLSKLNPIKNYTLNLHDSCYMEKNEIWQLSFIEGFDFKFSIIYFLILIVIMYLILFIIILKYDISISVNEE